MITGKNSRFCIHCLHFVTQTFLPETGTVTSVADCAMSCEPVSGERVPAHIAREFGGDCGPDGLLFERRVIDGDRDNND